MPPHSSFTAIPRRLQLVGRKRVENNGPSALPPPSVAVAAALAVAAGGGSGAGPAVALAADAAPAVASPGVAAVGAGLPGDGMSLRSSSSVRGRWHSAPSWDGPPDCGFLSTSPSSVERCAKEVGHSAHRESGGTLDAASSTASVVAAWPASAVVVDTAGWSPASGNRADDEATSPFYCGRGGGRRDKAPASADASPADAVLPRPTTRATAVAAATAAAVDSSDDEAVTRLGGRRVRPCRRRQPLAAATAASTAAATTAAATAAAAGFPASGGERALCAGCAASLNAPISVRSDRSTSARIDCGAVPAGALIEDSAARGGYRGRGETRGRVGVTASVAAPAAPAVHVSAAAADADADAGADADEPTAADVERLTAAAARLAVALVGAARVLCRHSRHGCAKDVLLDAMTGQDLAEAADRRVTEVNGPAAGMPPLSGPQPVSCRSDNRRGAAAAAVPAAARRGATVAPSPPRVPGPLARSSRTAAAPVEPSVTFRTPQSRPTADTLAAASASRDFGFTSAAEASASRQFVVGATVAGAGSRCSPLPSKPVAVAAALTPPAASSPQAWSFAVPFPVAQPPPGTSDGGWLAGLVQPPPGTPVREGLASELSGPVPAPVVSNGGRGTPPVPSAWSRGRVPKC